MTDPRYRSAVGGIGAHQRPDDLQSAINELERRFPGLGVTLFVVDVGDGDACVISNAPGSGKEAGQS